MESDQDRWDARWAEPKSAHIREPHPLLVRFIAQRRLIGGHGLDLACGVGQNAIWLAQRGFTVDAVDISRVALERGRRAALEAGVTVSFLHADLDVWQPNAAAYDLVMGFRFLNRKLWPRLRTALRPGGWLLYQTFNARKVTPDADFSREYLLDVGELLCTFDDWHIVESGEEGGPSFDQSWIVCRKLVCRKRVCPNP